MMLGFASSLTCVVERFNFDKWFLCLFIVILCHFSCGYIFKAKNDPNCNECMKCKLTTPALREFMFRLQ